MSKGNTIYLSHQTAALYIDLSAVASKTGAEIKSTVPDEVQRVQPWSPWGSDNLLPQRMVNDIETCGILNGIIEGKSRFAICQGMLPAIVRTNPANGQREIEQFVDDDEINEWMERNDTFFQTFALIKDQVGFNWGTVRYMMDGAGNKITNMQRDDLTEVRYSKKDPKTGRSSHLYYSANWDKVRSPNDERVFKRYLLNPADPLADLEEKIKSGIKEHAFTFRNPGWGKHYYPTPLWMAAYKWVKIAQGVPEMKSALFENAMRPKYMVIIHEEYWENRYGTEWVEWDEGEQEKRRNDLYDEIDNWLIGSKNAHKSIMAQGYRDEKGTYTDIEIKPIEDNTKPGELLPDSAAANSEIAFAMQYNLAINGGNQSAGIYQHGQGGSNIREASADQVIKHEVERQQLRRVMMLPKNKNGWAKRLKGLDFIIPATILTTLDTGAGSKQVITGNANPRQNNGTDNANN